MVGCVRWFGPLLVLTVVLVGVGCTENKVVANDAPEGALGGETNGPDAAAPDAGRTSSATSDGTCNALVQQGALYEHRTTRASAPVPTGGRIEDGVYVATSQTVYEDTEETTRPAALPPLTMEIRGSEVQTVSLALDGTTAARKTSRMTTNGTEIAFRVTCWHPDSEEPFGPAALSRYTFANGTLREFFTSARGTIELTLERRE